MVLQETVVDNAYIESMGKLREPVKGTSLFQASSDSVVVFAEKMLGFHLYAWQVDFLNRIQQAIDGKYYTKEFLALTSRQIGKSTAVAILSLWACVFNKYPGTVHNNTLVGIISASDVQAKKLLYEIKKLIRIGDGYCKRTYDMQLSVFSELLSTQDSNNTCLKVALMVLSLSLTHQQL
jgi:phage terminase large subunit-like protein